FCSSGVNPHPFEREGANHLTQKRDFLLLRLDQSDFEVGCKNLDRQAGKSGAGAKIDQRRSGVELKPLAGKERFAEVPAHDFFRITKRGEANAGVPFQQEVNISPELIELLRR